jgi:hypothetical protein
MNSPVADTFRQLDTDMNMERDGLFAAVAREAAQRFFAAARSA